MNRLYYIWCAGHGGATGEGPSGPVRLRRQILAPNRETAMERARPLATSWDGPVMCATTDPDWFPSVIAYNWTAAP